MSDAPPPPPPGGYGGGPTGPPGGYGGGPGPKPDNHLVWAILSTLFCCLPLGIASIVFASQVDSKWSSGDYIGARESSEKAKKFAMIAAGVGVGVIILFVLLPLMLGGSDTNY